MNKLSIAVLICSLIILTLASFAPARQISADFKTQILDQFTRYHCFKNQICSPDEALEKMKIIWPKLYSMGFDTLSPDANYQPDGQKTKFYFKWDDLEFLMQSASLGGKLVLTPVNEHFIPLFRSLFLLETRIAGVNHQFFFAVSLLMHGLVMLILFFTVTKITASRFYGLIGIILFSIFGPFADVLPWPTMQQILGSTLSAALAFWWYLKSLRAPRSKIPLLLLGLFPLFSGWWYGTGVGASLVFVISAIITRRKSPNLPLILTGLAGAIASFAGVLIFSRQNLSAVAQLSFSFEKLVKMAYYFLVGPSQGIISRFFIPGFTPNIYSPANIAAMITIPAFFLILWLIVYKSLRASPKFLTATLLFVYPYAISAPTRSANGPVSALNYRYSHFPLYFFIIVLILMFKTLWGKRPLPKYLILLLVSIYVILQYHAFNILVEKIYY